MASYWPMSSWPLTFLACLHLRKGAFEGPPLDFLPFTRLSFCLSLLSRFRWLQQYSVTWHVWSNCNCKATLGEWFDFSACRIVKPWVAWLHAWRWFPSSGFLVFAELQVQFWSRLWPEHDCKRWACPCGCQDAEEDWSPPSSPLAALALNVWCPSPLKSTIQTNPNKATCCDARTLTAFGLACCSMYAAYGASWTWMVRLCGKSVHTSMFFPAFVLASLDLLVWG